MDSHRVSARVLLVDDAGCLGWTELCSSQLGACCLGTVGGGLDAGEDLRTAALSQVREETGFELDELAGPVWLRAVEYTSEGHVLRTSIEYYFAAAVGPATYRRAPTPTSDEQARRQRFGFYSWAQVVEFPPVVDVPRPGWLDSSQRSLWEAALSAAG